MACRCQERRDAIKRAAGAKTLKEARKEAKFVATTLAGDARRLLFRGTPQK